MKFLIEFVYFCLLLVASHAYIRLPLHKTELNNIDSSLFEYILSEEDKSTPINKDGKKEALNIIHSGDFQAIIAIGSPPTQHLRLSLDTTSALTWMVSSDCKVKVCEKHNLFNHLQSRTYEGDSNFKVIHYGSKKLLGSKGKDTVTIGSIVAKRQLFALVRDLPLNYDSSNDGVLGLALSSKDEEEPLLQTMMQQGVLKTNIFSLYLNRTSSNEYSGSELILGGWNDQYFDSKNIDYIQLSKEENWQFTIDFISSVPNTYGIWCTVGCEAVIDTTQNFIVGPEKEIKAIQQYIGATPGKLGIIRCNQVKQLPPITFHINKKEYILDSKDYVIEKPIVGDFCATVFRYAHNPKNPWLIGYSFLSKFYTIFNAGEKKIAFAPLKK